MEKSKVPEEMIDVGWGQMSPAKVTIHLRPDGTIDVENTGTGAVWCASHGKQLQILLYNPGETPVLPGLVGNWEFNKEPEPAEPVKSTGDKGKDEWLKAKGIIGKFLLDLAPWQTANQVDHNAAAVIARLLGADPPLMIVNFNAVKDDMGEKGEASSE